MSDKYTSDFVRKDRERKTTARMARFYRFDARLAGKPFRFQGSFRQYVCDPDTGAVMSLEKYNARQEARKRNGRPRRERNKRRQARKHKRLGIDEP